MTFPLLHDYDAVNCGYVPFTCLSIQVHWGSHWGDNACAEGQMCSGDRP